MNRTKEVRKALSEFMPKVACDQYDASLCGSCSGDHGVPHVVKESCAYHVCAIRACLTRCVPCEESKNTNPLTEALAYLLEVVRYIEGQPDLKKDSPRIHKLLRGERESIQFLVTRLTWRAGILLPGEKLKYSFKKRDLVVKVESWGGEEYA